MFDTKTQPVFISTKTYTHSVGLSTAFRQWRAKSHCKYIHGYSLEVHIKFIEVGGLDSCNWVVDFGSLKPVKKWLELMFDHKMLVAEDDPEMDRFRDLHNNGLIKMVPVANCGCEAFAEMIYNHVEAWLLEAIGRAVQIYEVEVREHAGNSAIARNPKYVA